MGRVVYDVVTDLKTGRPRAENVEPEHYEPRRFAHGPAASPRYAPPPGAASKRTGTMLKDNGKFGFIQQDCGEEDMFILAPLGGAALPAVGTRVAYDVVLDAKTGRPRAENVEIESGGFGAVGKGKGKAFRSEPYGGGLH